MVHAQYCQEQQEAKRLLNRISSFLEDFKVGTLLGGSDIRKLRGAKLLAVFVTIFSLPFIGVNFSRPSWRFSHLGHQRFVVCLWIDPFSLPVASVAPCCREIQFSGLCTAQHRYSWGTGGGCKSFFAEFIDKKLG